MIFFKKRRKEAFPLFWEQYLDACKNRNNKQRPINEMDFVVLDTETSGLDLQTAEVLSFGGLHVKSYSIDVSTHLSVFFDRRTLPKHQSVAIHGILPNERKETFSEREGIEKIVAFIGASVIVGHHIRFDLMMLNKHLQNSFGVQLKNRWIDTAQLARRLAAPKLNHIGQGISLDLLCEYYHIKTHDRHTAIGDAFLTALVFVKQLKNLEKRGIVYEKDLFRKGFTTFRGNL